MPPKAVNKFLLSFTHTLPRFYRRKNCPAREPNRFPSCGIVAALDLTVLRAVPWRSSGGRRQWAGARGSLAGYLCIGRKSISSRKAVESDVRATTVMFISLLVNYHFLTLWLDGGDGGNKTL
ncbi:hypothetical protein EVAR_16031_1 [Eumeta japonica]|uniref:Uncharacterized protein n=1 Tax=Eumeta variegata TaxID=151549 RepID=A0A4C1W043_EUMVA|nr:hypothetical protein EVAR_16031_1 [Eumeta japonica]